MCGGAPWSRRAKHDGSKTHCAACECQAIETIALPTPLFGRSTCRWPRNPRSPNHGGVKLLRFARVRQCQQQRDEVCSRSRHVVVPTTSLDGTPLTSASEERADRSADQLVENEPGERGAHIPLDGARTSGTDVSFDLSGHLRG